MPPAISGTAGAAFLLHDATGVSLGKLFFPINLPFYGFAWWYAQFSRGRLARQGAVGRRLRGRAADAAVVQPPRVGWSVLAAVVTNLFRAVDHEPGRHAVCSHTPAQDCRLLISSSGAPRRPHRSFHMSILQRTSLAAATVLALSLNLAAVAQTATTAAPTTTPGLGPGPLSAASGANGSMAGSGNMSNGKLSGGDRTFVEKAAVGGMAEVALGKMAQDKGGSDAVKQYGAHMVDDHTKANSELMQIAGSKGVTPPADLDRKHKAVSDKLSKLSGAAFDREYVKAMVADHKDTAALMDKESKSGRDADLKAFAAKTLPTVQEHLQMATGMDGSMKGMSSAGAASMAK